MNLQNAQTSAKNFPHTTCKGYKRKQKIEFVREKNRSEAECDGVILVTITSVFVNAPQCDLSLLISTHRNCFYGDCPVSWSYGATI